MTAFQQLMSFKDAWSVFESIEEKHLLLGNGFSIAHNSDFNYRSLYEKIQGDDSFEKLKRIFEQFANEDHNFEKILYFIDASTKVAEVYDENDFLEKLKEEANILRTSLIQAINKVHPELELTMFDDMTGKSLNLSDSVNFIKLFLESSNLFNNKIFTTNYDLLIYYMYLTFLMPQKYRNFCDGFGGHPVSWPSQYTKNQTIHYLHGALHLFNTAHGSTHKLVSQRDGSDLIDLLEPEIKLGNYPIIVTEGSSQSKMERINQQPYLLNSFETLKAVEGCIVTFGFSFCDEDDHITKILKGKNFNRVYIGVYDNTSYAQAHRKMVQFGTPNQNITFYRTDTVLEYFNE